MRLTIPSIEIPPDEPFKNDVFGRKEFAERLTNLIKNTEDDNLVISLNAQWGEGKSTFVQMLRAYLELPEQGATTIYFDAFAHDYVDDAFTAITGEIYSKLKNIIPDKNLIDNLPKISGKVLSIIAQAGGNQIGLGDFFKNLIDNKIKKYEKDKESIKSFKKELENLAEIVRYKHPNNQREYPLIFIVDELDRCKPTYALDVIEKIKHFFSVKNVVFILVMNTKQMEDSVKSIYGTENASTYLQKFINLECVLPKQKNINIGDDYEKYSKHLYDSLKPNIGEHKKLLEDSIKVIARPLNLSLRELEKCYTYLTLFYSNEKSKSFTFVPLIVFLVIVKVCEPEIYRNLKKKNLLSHLELAKTNIYQDVFSKLDNYITPDLMNLLIYALPPHSSPSLSQQHITNIGSIGGLGADNIVHYLCDQLDSFEVTS